MAARPMPSRTERDEAALDSALDKFGSDKGGNQSTGETLRQAAKENA